MPGRNIYKEYVEESFCHVYNRGVNKGLIFRDQQDYQMFLNLLARYLDPATKERRQNGVSHPKFGNRVELLAYCLMPNHFHLFMYQYDKEAMRDLLKSITVAYSMYFNKRYQRVGPVFQQRYRAVLIQDDNYLLHISRYIHLNPANYREYKWSSLQHYLGREQADWLKPSRVLAQFTGRADYRIFVDDYKSTRDELDHIKHLLADTELLSR